MTTNLTSDATVVNFEIYDPDGSQISSVTSLIIPEIVSW